ncbi:hypothetical protein LT85_2926 [Collimonas arenae]|uniref:Uncharacterized protein n=1 Tax=Collimonas arenae TaxID=279058 RepID=A0A0A1FEJ0_9BURK|nr:hypothetical protein LT85_2926 [Collimonas arenae]
MNWPTCTVYREVNLSQMRYRLSPMNYEKQYFEQLVSV